MKKVLSVLVALLLIAVACVPAFAADAYKVDVESSADTAAVGDVITVSFKVSSGLSGFKGVLEYNTETTSMLQARLRLPIFSQLKSTILLTAKSQ